MSSALPSSVTVRVPAKINLELVVGPLRPDGYHDLSTVFHAVSVFDEVTVTPAPAWSVQVSGPYADLVPVGDDNLVVRAGRLLAERCGAAEAGPALVHIAKEIPVAGGMAGGSADAAATLVALDHLWGVGGRRDLWDECAAELGSDVNFALVGGTAIGSGRGEQIAPVLGRGRYHWVLVPSAQGLSTPTVFAELDRMRGAEATTVAQPRPGESMMQALRSGEVEALAAALRNDLQEPACVLQPRLREVVAAGQEFGALGAVVSGSGPTVAFLVDGPEGALDLAVALTASGVADEVVRAVGPVHGAHVVTSATP
ncbi:4-diphosphocytidyl-2-C-methyl-D-erythritol kinase [Austwickia sp. TVS 96-490-7B]|uniref:4-(cytidine 5'-diphospho)-2-C-methyl-D-erythritol kinase n=1 Tax=Austwickia sp. TVS 96-490-7B TaxID=2830843 RepID=UPI001C55BA5B|nr:4-(cytidine 5'-diphospho)-2-C-methyl-D-erythritol kinase [Austwickia sp. TVS 96-490-7B]MBW3085612.1 4-diphosphocytidyl-2-C-methyl-D-erythritol kinase [Austwickia sp. TVS 96-490-7B]